MIDTAVLVGLAIAAFMALVALRRGGWRTGLTFGLAYLTVGWGYALIAALALSGALNPVGALLVTLSWGLPVYAITFVVGAGVRQVRGRA